MQAGGSNHGKRAVAARVEQEDRDLQLCSNLELWQAKYQALVESFRESEGATTTKLNNAFIDFTKAITAKVHPSTSVLGELGCIDFLISVLESNRDPSVIGRTLTLFDRIVTYVGPELFDAFEIMTSSWIFTLEKMFGTLIEAEILDIAYLIIKCIKTSCVFSSAFTQRLYSSNFVELAKAWLDKISQTKTEDCEQRQLMEMIHYCIFEVFAYWLLNRESIAGMNVEFLVQSFLGAFDSSDEVILEQTCNLMKLILSKSGGDMWGILIESGIFSKVFELVVTSHTASAMDLISEGLITEQYDHYFARIVDFSAISRWVCEFFTEFCETPPECREGATQLFAASITLLSNGFVSEHLKIDQTLVDFFLSKAAELLEEAPYEAKESLAFLVLVLFRGVHAAQMPEYISILSHALNVASAGSEDVVEQSLRTITQIMDTAHKCGTDLSQIPAFNEVITYLRGIVDAFEGGSIEENGNLILDRIEDELGLTID